jgi:excisionase family DNA binding protein
MRFMGTDTTTPRLLLSVKDVGQALGVSERYVKTLIYSGALPSVTIGRLRRAYEGDLHAYIDERREAARQLRRL